MDAALEGLLDAERERALPAITPRDVRVPHLENMATTLVGMRRVGKSYLLLQQMQEILMAGVPRSSMLTMNLEDDRLGVAGLTTLDQALEYLFRTGPARCSEVAYLFLDEIQVVVGWEQFALKSAPTALARTLQIRAMWLCRFKPEECPQGTCA